MSSKLLTLNYWFALQSGGQFAFYSYTLGLAIALLIISVGLYVAYKLKLYKSPYKKIIKSSSSWLMFFGVAVLFLTFFRLENALLLSMRIWFVLVGCGFVVWVLFLIRAILKEKNRILLREKLKAIRSEESKEKEDLHKYIPKSKKKKKKKR